jgi:hypothetical protein
MAEIDPEKLKKMVEREMARQRKEDKKEQDAKDAQALRDRRNRLVGDRLQKEAEEEQSGRQRKVDNRWQDDFEALLARTKYMSDKEFEAELKRLQSQHGGMIFNRPLTADEKRKAKKAKRQPKKKGKNDKKGWW